MKKLLLLMFGIVLLGGCSIAEQEGGVGSEVLTIYSGRNEKLVGALIDDFRETVDYEVEVRYAGSTEQAVAILEEGENTKADVFLSQDAGNLGVLSEADALDELPESVLGEVEDRFQSEKNDWVGVSGRARTVVYSTASVNEGQLPDSIFGFCDPEWRGRIGWAPTNASFQSFVTALVQIEGEEKAREWIQCIQANEPTVYPKNTPIVEAASRDEVAVGFVNHYYLHRFTSAQEDFAAANYFLPAGDAGALINVAGVGVLKNSDQKDKAQDFVTFLLSQDAQQYFVDETFEYPLVSGVASHSQLPALDSIVTPDFDLNDLSDIDTALTLLKEEGVI